MRGTIVIAGSVAQKPLHGGHAWVFLQYLLGFRKLGWDVLFLDSISPELCVNTKGEVCPFEDSVNLRQFQQVMDGFGLRGAYSLACGDRFFGVPRNQVLQSARQSALLLNVMGFLRDPEILDAAPRRVFLDIDPGFGQMWQELELFQTFSGHHAYVTVGENIGLPGCRIPSCGLSWITTRPPVDLDCWTNEPGGGGAGFTTIASWRGCYGPIPFHGKTYGLRVHEFRKFFALPTLTSQRFEAALDIHPADAADRAALERNQWHLIDPRAVSADPWSYRTYIAESGAEFSVAKNMYVDTWSGWFSDRSACYLASGKPVLVQDTGLRHLYPTGKGLLTFQSPEEAVCRAEELSRDYAAHSAAAREIAVEYFDSRKVLCRLLQKLSVN